MEKILLSHLGSVILALPIALSAHAEDGGTPVSGTESSQAVDTLKDGAQSPTENANLELESIPVAAASETTEEKRPASSNRSIEEIVITAQKREERLQDVPISIQAFSSDALSAKGIETTSQLGQSVPSLQFTSVLGYDLIYMRGIGTDNFIPSADPSIATYVDGIYTPQGQGTTQSLGNIERVEVLKGPQGTLFGRNSTGGAISIVTKEPGDTPEASFESSAGSFDAFAARANISTPLTDWISFGVSAAYNSKDSYYKVLYTEPQKEISRAARVKVNIHPTDDLSLSVTASHSDQQGAGTTLYKNIAPSPLGRILGIQPQKDNYTVESDFQAQSSSFSNALYGNAQWSLPWLDIKILGSDQYISTTSIGADFEASRLPIAAFEATDTLTNGGGQFADIQSAELQLISNEGTWGADRFQWVTGVYYFHSKAGYDVGVVHVAPGALTSAAALVGLEIPEALSDLLGRAPLGSTPLGPGGAEVSVQGVLGTNSVSAYTQGTYTFSDWFDFTFGARVQKEDRYLVKAETGAVNPITQKIIPLLPFNLVGSTAKNISPKGVLSFHPTEGVLLYGSYSVGFKSGTYNVVNIYTPPNYIKPEKVTTYELGLKGDFLNGQLRINGALFYNDIKNLQSGFLALLSGGAVRFQTAGSARTRGAEFDATWLPMPDLNPGLLITANGAYVDAIYTSFKDGSGFSPVTGIYAENLDFSGNRIVRNPKLSGGVGIVQSIEAPGGSVEIAVDEYFNSGFYFDAYNTIEEHPYAVLNGRVSYLYEPWRVRVTVFGQNLLDRRYHLQQFQQDFGVNSTLAAPITYGVRLNWDF